MLLKSNERFKYSVINSTSIQKTYTSIFVCSTYLLRK